MQVQQPSDTVHPRVCGEHVTPLDVLNSTCGSSPRVRGTHICRVHVSCFLRFIPACAGNTSRKMSAMDTIPVHPRVCGEHRSSTSSTAASIGSSPRVRGTLVDKLPGPEGRRFIPACAGNTPIRRASKASFTVHPRVCGEHLMALQTQNPKFGSSPRVRGTPDKRP